MKLLGPSIKVKLLLPFFIVSLFFLGLGQIFIYFQLSSLLSSSLDIDLKQTTETLHGMMEISFRESIVNYLRGITEQNIHIIEALYNRVQLGELTNEEAQSDARFFLLSENIGDDGYTYVADSSGIIRIHPKESLLGEKSIFASTFLNRDKQPEEYVEYEFEGRLKVLYRQYFEPWDWIIATTAYREEFQSIINLNLLDQSFSSSLNQGYSFIMDPQGNFLVHPEFKGQRGNDNFQEILKLIQAGKIQGIFEWSDDNESYRMFYRQIDDFDWIIGSVFFLSNFYKPISRIILIVALLNSLSFLLLFVILSSLVKRIISPLNGLTLRMLEEEGTELDELFHMGDEIQILENVFDLYLQRLHQEQKRVAQINEENRILAQYPHDLQFPLLRISTAGEVLFLNQAAQEQIFDLMVDHGSYIDPIILEKMGELEDMEGRFNLVMGDKSYQIVVTPMQQSSELFLHFHDLTMEYSYQTLQSIWENVFDSTLEGFAVTDDQGIIEEINSSFSRITGYSKEEVIGLETKLLRSDRHDHQFFENMWNQLHEMGHWQGEVWNRKKDGEVYQEWLSISSFHNRQSDETKYVAIFHDITDIRQKEEELNHIIHHDILTDLPNRNSFYEELSTALHTRDSNTILAVIILDLDNFTMIYNYLGSALGDDFLQYLSEVFKSVTRVDDIVARLGSAEFAICIRSIENFVVCQRMINRLQDKLDNSVELAGHSLTPFINIGISLCPKDGDTPELLIRRARLAMQHGRQIRKGSHLYFEPSMEKNQLDRFDADISLKAALKNNEFVMEYQPLSSFIDGVIHGFEALIRWDRPSKGRISPTQFIPVLEENGMILEVGEWILKEVCQFISQLRMIDPFPFKIGVNISARQFASANFVDRLLYICETYKVPSHFIDLEITENIAALDLEGVIDTLSSLRKYGFSISIDDFGTGYSSLSYLKELPFDILKIDRSFIAPIEEKGTSLAIVRSVVTLAKSLGKKTVAEGVETKMQSRICREEGCDILQGFLYSVPLSIEDALDFVKIKSKDLKNLNQDS